MYFGNFTKETKPSSTGNVADGNAVTKAAVMTVVLI